MPSILVRQPLGSINMAKFDYVKVNISSKF